MRNEILSQTVQTIKAQFNATPGLRVDDLEKYNLKGIQRPNHKGTSRISGILGTVVNKSEDFYNRWDSVCAVYKEIQSIESISKIRQSLNDLRVYLETLASRDRTYLRSFEDREGKTQMLWLTRELGIDQFFEDRVLIYVRKAIARLDEMPPGVVFLKYEHKRRSDQLASSQCFMRAKGYKNPGRKKSSPKQFNDIWLGEESQFWEIVKTYANEFIEILDSQISWRTIPPGITYLAGFTAECQKKGWIAKGKHSAPSLQKFYQNLFCIKFDPKPFQPNNLNSIAPIYTQPFKGIRHRLDDQSRKSL